MPRLRAQAATSRRRPRTVPAVERAVRVLRALAADGAAPRLSDLGRTLGLSKSTLSDLLATLASHGLVERDGDSQGYRLGPTLLELGSAALRHLDVAQLARPYLARLRDAIGETAVLHVPADDAALIVARAESHHDLMVAAPLGHRLPPLAGAVAKVLLADRPEADVVARLRSRLPAFTPKSITAPGRYVQELRRVRRLGYAVDDEEYLPGVRAVSAPVRDARGRVVATLTVVGSSARLPRGRLGAVADAVVAAATALSRRLGAPADAPPPTGAGPGAGAGRPAGGRAALPARRSAGG
ncbi:MAG: IclR family transcriptional regulator [Armatimonadota bacterium]|nr:IclR family transcriptional regulator [Armatimonadota bacterium]MDR7535556.1 IclR family transcriptional regulator [Armatimonadota bacterium]